MNFTKQVSRRVTNWTPMVKFDQLKQFFSFKPIHSGHGMVMYNSEWEGHVLSDCAHNRKLAYSFRKRCSYIIFIIDLCIKRGNEVGFSLISRSLWDRPRWQAHANVIKMWRTWCDGEIMNANALNVYVAGWIIIR